jgi:hypothetical protein
MQFLLSPLIIMLSKANGLFYIEIEPTTGHIFRFKRCQNWPLRKHLHQIGKCTYKVKPEATELITYNSQLGD